ncbi:MAG: glycosyltransferase family 39 protein [Pirellulales bacterium]
MNPVTEPTAGAIDPRGRLAATAPFGGPPAADFPCHLDAPRPLRPMLPPAGRLLALLVVLCLVPRALMAYKLDVLCRDGVFYIQLAEAFAAGDLEGGLDGMRLNLYPLILLELHRAGLDWELGGKCWGVLVSSLVVLPLFGWLRRQFDQSVALAACLLYAVHPKLIEWSPELIRDSTFWLFWTLALYCSWRATTEVRIRWYVAAGTAITLALHTRFEGWFLLFPLVWWSAMRWRVLIEDRRRVLPGLLLAALTYPLFLLAVNLTWLAEYPRWELGSFVRLQYVMLWCRSAAGLPPASVEPAPPATATPAAAAAPTPSGPAMPAPPPQPAPQRMSPGRTLVVFANTMRRSMGAVFGIVWLIGMWGWRPIWLRREHRPLTAMVICTLAGIWIHLWYAQATSSRYALTIVLLGSHCAALGWLGVCHWLARLAHKLGESWPRPPGLQSAHLLAVTMVLFGAIGLGTALAGSYEGRRREAELGKWLLANFGPGQRVVTSSQMSLLEHYAQSPADALPPHAGREWSGRALVACQPEIAVFSRREVQSDVLEHLLDEAARIGMKQVDRRRLPVSYDWQDLIVLQRDRTAIHTAARPPAG